MEVLPDQFFIFTIGYGNRKFEDFAALLKQHRINYLIDVRSSPFSKYNPIFSQPQLRNELNKFKIRYVFMGNELGGKPKDRDCFVNGKVDYKKVERKDFYQKGVDRLKTAYRKEIKVALMCTELKPQSCHRSKLIGQTLVSSEIEVGHIDEMGSLLSQADVISRINKGQDNLFAQNFTSRKSYI